MALKRQQGLMRVEYEFHNIDDLLLFEKRQESIFDDLGVGQENWILWDDIKNLWILKYQLEYDFFANIRKNGDKR